VKVEGASLSGLIGLSDSDPKPVSFSRGHALCAKSKRKRYVRDAAEEEEILARKLYYEELRNMSRYEPVDEVDPELYTPSKLSVHLDPPEDIERFEIWDTP